MNIEDVIDIAEGKLLNAPFISSFGSMTTNPSLVKRSDLFIALDGDNLDDNIDEALRNGAYGILLESEYNIKDEEIAWIIVDDMKRALLRLVKFFFITKDYDFILLNPIQFNIVSNHFKNQKKIGLLSDDIKSDFDTLITDNKSVFFTMNEDFLNRLNLSFFNYSNFILPPHEILNDYIFDVKFIYEKHIHNIRIARLFFDDFLKLYHFLNSSGINISFHNVNIKNNFIPHFLDSSGNLLEFGKSDRVLISENNEIFFNEEIRYLIKTIKWTTLSIFVSIKNKYLIDKSYENKIFFYNDIDELIKKIQSNLRGFMFIDIMNEDILMRIKKQHKQEGLFLDE